MKIPRRGTSLALSSVKATSISMALLFLTSSELSSKPRFNSKWIQDTPYISRDALSEWECLKLLRSGLFDLDYINKYGMRPITNSTISKIENSNLKVIRKLTEREARVYSNAYLLRTSPSASSRVNPKFTICYTGYNKCSSHIVELNDNNENKSYAILSRSSTIHDGVETAIAYMFPITSEHDLRYPPNYPSYSANAHPVRDIFSFQGNLYIVDSASIKKMYIIERKLAFIYQCEFSESKKRN